MEHRHSSRARSGYLVMIFQNDVAVAVGKTKNIGGDGLFVRSEYRVTINQPLEIQFIPKGSNSIPSFRLKTHVAHKAADGFGLELIDTDPGRHILQKLMQGDSEKTFTSISATALQSNAL